MSDKDTSTIYIDNSKQFAYGRYCDLCGEEFTQELTEHRTVCPACRIAWRKIRGKVLFENESEE